MEPALMGSLITLAVVLARVIQELIRDRRAPGQCGTASSDCYYPTDRDRDGKTHCNVVKLCHKHGIDPEV